MRLLTSLIICILFINTAAAQNEIAERIQHEIDSLRAELATAKTDLERGKLYHGIARDFDNLDSLEYYELFAIDHAFRANDYATCAASCYNIGYAHLIKEDFAGAIEFSNKSLGYAKHCDVEKVGLIQGRCYMQLANAYFYQGFQQTHNTYIDSAIMKQSEIGDTLEMITSYMILANNACSSGLYDVAIEHYATCERFSMALGDSINALICQIYICNVHLQRYIYNHSYDPLDEAMKAIHKAARVLDYVSEMDRDSYFSIINDLFAFYTNQAQCYLHMYQRTNDKAYIDSCETAVNYISRSKFTKEYLDSHSAEFYRILAYLELAKGNYQKAVDIAHKNLIVSDDDTTSVVASSNKYDILASAYEKLGRYRDALIAHKKWSDIVYKFVNDNQMRQAIEYKDKLRHDEAMRQVELENLRQLMEKQNKIERSRIIAISMAAGLVLLVFIVIYILRSLNNKKRLNQQLSEKNTMLNEYNEEIMVQRDQLNAQNKQIFDSINYAKYIQTAAISSPNEVMRLFADSFVYYHPKDIVSGDWYRVGEFNGLRFVIVADCTGHGVPGALLSMLGISTLKEILAKSSREELRPATILNQMRQSIVTSLSDQHDAVYKAEDGMDISICIVDSENMQMLFGAANHDITIVRNGEATKYKGDRMPIGRYTTDYKPFTEQTIELQHGDMVYVYTDGVKDQHGKNGRKFLYKNQTALLCQMSNQPAAQQLQTLTQTIENFASAEEQTDDMTMLGFRI